MTKITFGVITKVPPVNDPDGGNLAVALPLYFRTKDGSIQDSVAVLGAGALSAMYPVFDLGEILILDDTGREVSGKGRKPLKWFVTCEHFQQLEEAIKRAREVTRGPDA